MSKEEFSRNLLAADVPSGRASDKIPILAKDAVSDRAKETLNLIQDFIEKVCIPNDTVYFAQLGDGEERWTTYPPVIDDLKAKAKKLGLWNLFLPRNHFKEGAGFTNLEYGLMAEYMGRSRIASEACNCAAPDTGNMEVLARYGNDAQKADWLQPLLDGRIRSAFLMTEPEVASSDATNIQLTMQRDGDEYILNGTVSGFDGFIIVADHLQEMVVERRWRPTLQIVHCYGQIRPHEQECVPAAICDSCASWFDRYQG